VTASTQPPMFPKFALTPPDCGAGASARGGARHPGVFYFFYFVTATGRAAQGNRVREGDSPWFGEGDEAGPRCAGAVDRPRARFARGAGWGRGESAVHRPVYDSNGGLWTARNAERR
jgi:hypothetical protein